MGGLSASSWLPLLPIALLFVSNIFMTAAWYGHLKFPHAGMIAVVFIAWGIAFIEYCFAVPANRIGYKFYSAAELKTIQEVITLVVFVGFSVWFLGEKITLHHVGGFILIALGAALIFHAPKTV